MGFRRATETQRLEFDCWADSDPLVRSPRRLLSKWGWGGLV